MAAALPITSEGGQYNGRMTLLLVLSCLMAATGGVLFGYDLGISGLFQYDHFYIIFPLLICKIIC